jgi:hypothetical protein
MSEPNSKVIIIKNIYLYLVSFVALMMLVISTADIINIGLKTFVFKNADNYRFGAKVACDFPREPGQEGGASALSPEECVERTKNQEENERLNRISDRERSLVRDISFIIVGLPLFYFHWRVVRKK